MAKVELLAPYIKQWEGGFVNDPADKGGATNMGVTLSTYEVYCRGKGYPRPTVEVLKRLTAAEWLDILKTMYWDKWQADAIKSQKVANILVDWLWLSGTYGVTIPQKLLGVTADGVVGENTIQAVNAANPDKLFDTLFEARKRFYQRSVDASIKHYETKIGRRANRRELLKYTNQRFLNGWLKRLEALRAYSR